MRAIEYPVDLVCHDEIVLVQPLDFLGTQRNARVALPEADIGVMAFGFSQVTYVSNKTKCLLKIAEANGSFDAVAVIEQIPIRSMRLKPLRLLMCEWWDADATQGSCMLGGGV